MQYMRDRNWKDKDKEELARDIYNTIKYTPMYISKIAKRTFIPKDYVREVCSIYPQVFEVKGDYIKVIKLRKKDRESNPNRKESKGY